MLACARTQTHTHARAHKYTHMSVNALLNASWIHFHFDSSLLDFHLSSISIFFPSLLSTSGDWNPICHEVETPRLAVVTRSKRMSQWKIRPFFSFLFSFFFVLFFALYLKKKLSWRNSRKSRYSKRKPNATKWASYNTNRINTYTSNIHL